MSMEISTTYGNYGTSTAGRTAAKETGQRKSAAEYAEYLAKNYDCVKNGSVAISGSFLRQCADDPEKAKFLEENLSLYNEICDQGYESAKRNAEQHGGKLVSYSQTWSIDSEGNISAMTRTTSVYDNGTNSQKELREELEAKRKEKKEEAAKLEKKAAQKKEKEEQLEKIREKNSGEDENTQTYEVRMVGRDVSQMSEKMNEALSRAIAAKTALSGTVGIDIKA